MADIRRVTDTFSVAPQLRAEEVAMAAAQGFVLLINNRPDGEAPGQPSSATMQSAAVAAGVAYIHIPFVGAPAPGQMEAMHDAIEAADGPVLAFCRSGTRSVTLWARGQATKGDRSRTELLSLAHEAGYDLSGSL